MPAGWPVPPAPAAADFGQTVLLGPGWIEGKYWGQSWTMVVESEELP